MVERRQVWPNSFRRANITWRQEVGGSSIEASKIAGHNGLTVTSEYTFVSAERQNELTRRIQEKLARAAIAARSGEGADLLDSAAEPSEKPPDAPDPGADATPGIMIEPGPSVDCLT